MDGDISGTLKLVFLADLLTSEWIGGGFYVGWILPGTSVALTKRWFYKEI